MAEQVVGSDKAFRMAVEEMLGRALKKGELEEMMQKKMLDPEVLLPLVGKYFHKLAEDGGALKKKLLQLETIEMRMKTQWTYFVRSLYDKGVEAALIKLYKGLARVSNSMNQLASSAIGKFLKGVLDAISFVALNLLDVFQIVIYLIDQAFGKSSDIKSTTAEILGWVVAFAAMAKIATGIFRTMKAIAGISAMASLGGAAKTGMIGRVLIIGAEAAFFFGITNAIIDALGIRKKLGKIGGDIYSATHQTDPNKPGFGQFTFDKITPFLSSNNAHNSTGSSIRAMQQEQAIASGVPLWLQNAQNQQSIDVKITMDRNAKDLIKAEVQQNTQQQINSLIPPFLRPKQ